MTDLAGPDVQTVKPSEVSSDPKKIPVLVVIERLYVVRGKGAVLLSEPSDMAGLPVQIVYSASFRSYVYVAMDVFSYTSDYWIAEPFTFEMGRLIQCVCLLARIEPLDTVEIGSEPNVALPIFGNAPY